MGEAVREVMSSAGRVLVDEVKSDLNLTGQRWRVHIPKHFRPNRMTENPVTCGAYRSRTLLNSGEEQIEAFRSNCNCASTKDWETEKIERQVPVASS